MRSQVGFRKHHYKKASGDDVFYPMSKSLSGKREGFQDNAIHKKGSLLLTQVGAFCRDQRSGAGSEKALSRGCYPNLYSMRKRLVAGLSGLVTCLQSNFIGTNLLGLFSNLGVHGLFSSPFVSYWAQIDWLAPGYLMAVGNLTISGEAKI